MKRPSHQPNENLITNKPLHQNSQSTLDQYKLCHNKPMHAPHNRLACATIKVMPPGDTDDSTGLLK